MGCDIQIVQRIRHPHFQYISVPTSEEAELLGIDTFVYCYETKLLISCQVGLHYLAVQEHLLDFLERNGLRTFPEPIPYSLSYRKFTKEELALMDDFIGTQLYLHGTDREYDIQRALY